MELSVADTEAKRTPNAYTQGGETYLRVDLEGKVRLTNHRKKPVEVEIIRHALGHIDNADHNGKVEMNNVFESTDYLSSGDSMYPAWWSWYSWPWWWHQVNGVGG